MDFSSVKTFEDMLMQLPPEMSNLIRMVLMEPKVQSQEKIYEKTQNYIGSVMENPEILTPHINPIVNSLPSFIIVCLLICFIINFLTSTFLEFMMSKRPVLRNRKYSPIGYSILDYCHNYDKIHPGNLRDDIDNIYARCLRKYDSKTILQQREDEIIADRKRAKKIKKIYVAIFLVTFLFFFVFIGMGGVYIGLEIKGILTMILVTYATKKTYPFVFSSKLSSYEILQVKEYRNMIENYELEKIQNLK